MTSYSFEDVTAAVANAYTAQLANSEEELTAQLSFETDRFSTYALLYTDTAVSAASGGSPATGDSGTPVVWMLLLAAAVLALGGMAFVGIRRGRKA